MRAHIGRDDNPLAAPVKAKAQVGRDPFEPADNEDRDDLDDAHRTHTITRVRIAYVCYWFLLDKDGVAYKIDGQVDRWRELGHEVEVFCLTRARDGREPKRPGWRTIPFHTMRGRVSGIRRLASEVTAWQPDAIYLRYDFFRPSCASPAPLSPVGDRGKRRRSRGVASTRPASAAGAALQRAQPTSAVPVCRRPRLRDARARGQSALCPFRQSVSCGRQRRRSRAAE